MPRYSEEQLQKLHDERKQQIIKAAIKIFSKFGIKGTKISMITKETGLCPTLASYVSGRAKTKRNCLGTN